MGAAVVAAWLLLSLLAWLAVPPIVRWQAQTRLGAALGRDVRIETVRFNPWRLAVSVEGLRIAGITDVPMLTVARIDVDIAASSLVARAPVIEALAIDTLRLRVARVAPGRYDVDDVLRRFVPPPTATPANDAAPVRFAVYNAQIHDAAVRFDDRPAHRVQEVTALDLALPFLSNLPNKLDVQVEPRLAFKLNGVAFDSSGLAKPFAETRSGALKLAVRSLDLAPYLDYLPQTFPVRIAAGSLSTDLALRFSVPPKGVPVVALQGTVGVSDVRVVDHDGAPVVAWRRANVDVRSAEPLARRVRLASLRFEGAEASVRRRSDGTIALPGSVPPASAAPPSNADASAVPWQIELDRIDVADSAIVWSDAAVRPATALRVSGLTVGVDHLRWPLTEPFRIDARGALQRPGAPGSAGGRLVLQGSASTTAAALRVSVETLPLDAVAGYVAEMLTPRVDGRVSAAGRIDWAQAGPTRLALDSVAVDALVVRSRDAPPGSAAAALARRVSLNSVDVDLAARAVRVGKVSLDAPSLAVARDRQGRLDLARWIVEPAVPPPPSTLPPWRVEFAEAALTDGRLEWADGAVAADPVRVVVADLRLALQRLTWEGARPTVPAQFTASARIGSTQTPGEPASRLPGAFDWRGVVGVAPLEVIGSLKAERLPVHLLMPYAGDVLPVRIAHAELGIDGQVSIRQLPGGLDVDAGGDVLLGAVRVDAAPAPGQSGIAESLLRWNTLGLKGVRVAVKPGATPKLDIAEALLSDFFSRLVVTEEGRLNVRELAGGAAPAPPARPAAAKASGRLPIELRLGATTLANGKIDFSDHFVRPNYSAALTELNGHLGALDSTRPAMAPLSLRGKAAGTAQLQIDGTVDPLAQPPTLDLRAKATDLELAPLSPYAGKYAGYAIERGKLSMDVAYRLGSDGKLDATNRVVLNQLTFGDRIESPTATSLPVLFAVSLLKDRNGVIDLDLPISGSLNDPQFSVAGLIGRLLVNLLTKAIMSPFSLLTRGSGGGAPTDTGRVAFVPGTSRLAPAGAAAIDTVAEALSGKPGLLLTVTGTADAAHEQEAYRDAVLEARIEAARRKASVASAAAASAALPPLDDDARTRLLRQLYRESDLPDRPRNLFGLLADLPPPDMEARLKAAIPMTPDTVRALALQRGVGVRDALVAKGLPSDRLFLAAPKIDDAGAAPEARLELTPR